MKIEYRKLKVKLGKAQRANKKKLARNLHKRIKNKRLDYLHKQTTNLVKKYKNLFIGNLSSGEDVNV